MRFSPLRGVAVVEPLGEYVNGFVEVMNGHLVGCATYPAIKCPNSIFKVHLAFDGVVVGAKGALEQFGQFHLFLGNDLDSVLFEKTGFNVTDDLRVLSLPFFPL